MPTRAYQPIAADFERAVREQSAEHLARPSLSYWQDAWRRLKVSPRALISLYIVASLLLFTLFGPMLWPVDPARQVLDNISQGPSWSKSAVLVADHERWPGVQSVPVATSFDDADQLLAPGGLVTQGPPTSEAVRLVWDPVSGASGYHLYRHELEPSSHNDLGLPLAEITSASRVSYEDRMGLETIRYYYSVVPALDAQESRNFATITVDVQQAISISEARYRGLIGPDEGVERIGDAIHLESHPLGTDYLGRDILARIIYGARTSLFIGITAPFLYVLIGLVYGGIAGYLGGKIDNLMMRLADFVIALPFLLFVILFKIAFGIGPGESGVIPMMIAMIVLFMGPANGPVWCAARCYRSARKPISRQRA